MSLVLETGTDHFVITINIFLMLRPSTRVQDQSAEIILQTPAQAHIRNQKERRLLVMIMLLPCHHRELRLFLYSAH